MTHEEMVAARKLALLTEAIKESQTPTVEEAFPELKDSKVIWEKEK